MLSAWHGIPNRFIQPGPVETHLRKDIFIVVGQLCAGLEKCACNMNGTTKNVRATCTHIFCTWDRHRAVHDERHDVGPMLRQLGDEVAAFRPLVTSGNTPLDLATRLETVFTAKLITWQPVIPNAERPREQPLAFAPGQIAAPFFSDLIVLVGMD